MFTVIPAIDLRQGQVVRLKQGDYAQQTVYADQPYTLVDQYLAAGARWLHIVDLDGARSGSLENLAVIKQMAAAGIQIQAGGGVRQREDIERLFDAGVERVVIGSMAIRDPIATVKWLQQYGPEHLTLALDTRWHDGRWSLPSAGWTETETQSLDQLAPWYAAQGAKNVLCTDIERDGMLAGFNLDLYRDLSARAPSLQIQASGGVRSVQDIEAAASAGASAVILGRALLEGRFSLQEALCR